MKARFVIILLLSLSSNLWAQFENKFELIYDWEEVQNSNPDTVFAISFAKQRLEALPVALSKFKQLRILNLEKNKLTALPDFIVAFDQLEELNIGRNKLETFPVQVCRMRSIKNLIMNRNKVESIPECISYLSNLRYLDLYDCPIGKLPDAFESLKELKEIDLSGIRFSEEFQQYWINRLPDVKWTFDAPCDCMD